MDKSYLIKILHKYSKGEATAEERQFLISYYKLFDLEIDITDEMSSIETQSVREEIKDNIWVSLQSADTNEIKKRGPRMLWFVRAAAVILVILISGIQSDDATKNSNSGNISLVNSGELKQLRLLQLPDESIVMLNSGSSLMSASPN